MVVDGRQCAGCGRSSSRRLAGGPGWGPETRVFRYSLNRRMCRPRRLQATAAVTIPTATPPQARDPNLLVAGSSQAYMQEWLRTCCRNGRRRVSPKSIFHGPSRRVRGCTPAGASASGRKPGDRAPLPHACRSCVCVRPTPYLCSPRAGLHAMGSLRYARRAVGTMIGSVEQGHMAVKQ